MGVDDGGDGEDGGWRTGGTVVEASECAEGEGREERGVDSGVVIGRPK